MPKCSGLYGTPEKVPADVHIVFFPDDDAAFKKTADKFLHAHKAAVLNLRTRGDFRGKHDEILPFVGSDTLFLLVGLGLPDNMTRTVLRNAAAKGAKEAMKFISGTIALHLPFNDSVKRQHIAFDELVECMTEGASLALYKFDKYLTKDPEAKKGLVKELKIVTTDEGFQGTMKSAIDRVSIIVDGVELARNLTNAPPSEVNPEALAKEARALAKKFNLKVVVLNRKEIEAGKMGGLLAVNRGSSNEPRFIVLEYNTTKRKYPLYALVGKGVTFDSGGLSIKPAKSMEEMKMDMAGAAAVLGTIHVAAKLKLPVRLVGLIPATDNMTGSSALCPGDIITISNGKTVEVLNTDAEGRLILADALVYAQRYKPDGIIDLATLTGACVVALASYASGMMGTGDELKTALKTAGERTDERVWELPLFAEHEKLMKSTIADLKNIGGKWAGASTAAAFLKAFVGDIPWVHLDIAGTAILEEATDTTPKGGSGVGVRLLTDFFRSLPD